MPSVLLLDTLASTVLNSRGSLIRALVREGYSVTVATPDLNPGVTAELSKHGVSLVQIPFARTGMNPAQDLLSIYKIYSVVKKLKPDIYLGVTVKPSTLGVIAAWFAGVPNRFALITGLGYAFTQGNEFKRRVANFAAKITYRIGLAFANKVIFQNDDDKNLFTSTGLAKDGQVARVNGSGVDLARFAAAPLPPRPFSYLMIGRLLRDKGVREYAAAARIVKAQHPQARFSLIGAIDQNPTAITNTELQGWIADGIIEYGGTVEDVRQAIAACHVLVLPSYREGIPKTVLEGLAMGRPIITTTSPGCRETVQSDANGILVPARDVHALVAAELQLMMLPEQDLAAYALESRALAERAFDEKLVVKQFLDLLSRKEAGPRGLDRADQRHAHVMPHSTPVVN